MGCWNDETGNTLDYKRQITRDREGKTGCWNDATGETRERENKKRRQESIGERINEREREENEDTGGRETKEKQE